MEHHYPRNDTREHLLEGTTCPCGAEIDWEEHRVLHRPFDKGERFERRDPKTVRSMTTIGCDIVGEISVVQRVLEADNMRNEEHESLRRTWLQVCAAYSRKDFHAARVLMKELRARTELVLRVGFSPEGREKFLDKVFDLGYCGWVEAIDRRLK